MVIFFETFRVVLMERWVVVFPSPVDFLEDLDACWVFIPAAKRGVVMVCVVYMIKMVWMVVDESVGRLDVRRV